MGLEKTPKRHRNTKFIRKRLYYAVSFPHYNGQVIDSLLGGAVNAVPEMFRSQQPTPDPAVDDITRQSAQLGHGLSRQLDDHICDGSLLSGVHLCRVDLLPDLLQPVYQTRGIRREARSGIAAEGIGSRLFAVRQHLRVGRQRWKLDCVLPHRDRIAKGCHGDDAGPGSGGREVAEPLVGTECALT